MEAARLRSGVRAAAPRDAPVLKAAERGSTGLAVSARFGIALSLAALVLPFEPEVYRLGIFRPFSPCPG